MQRVFSILFVLSSAFSQLSAQSNLYFPPLVGNTWATTPPADLNFCTDRIDSLYNFLDAQNTKSFLLLKDGKIVLERYFDGHGQDSLWYWASAGKSLSAYLMGVAMAEYNIDIEAPASNWLGVGWSTAPPDKEALIKVRHVLSMTSGLDELATVPGMPNIDNCTDPACLQYKADAGTRWAYHNQAYFLSQKLIEKASGTTINAYTKTRLFDKIGAKGLWFNHVMISNARSMARFGLLAQAQGNWNGNALVPSQAYVQAMSTPSQTLNRSYGYLWWLNGQQSFMLPSLQLVFPGTLIPNAPADMYAALGKNDQKIHIVPSKGWVVVRMGDAATVGMTPGGGTVPVVFDNELWRYLNALPCASATEDVVSSTAAIVTPNPTAGTWQVNLPVSVKAPWQLFDSKGIRVGFGRIDGTTITIDAQNLPAGVYQFACGSVRAKLVKVP